MTQKEIKGRVLFDTCVLLTFFLNEDEADIVEDIIKLVMTGKITGFITSASIVELTTTFIRKNKEQALAELMELLNQNFIILNMTPDTAILAGGLKAKYQKFTKGFSHVDAVISASAIIHNCIVLTYDTEFDRVVEIQKQKPKEFWDNFGSNKNQLKKER